MKQLQLFVALVVSILTLAGTARETQVPSALSFHFCGEGYRYDSYGLGAGSGYKREQFIPFWRDEGCYQQGLSDGKKVAAQYPGDAWCVRAFGDATKLGFAGDMPVITSPSECSHLGYIFGRSYLADNARRGRRDVVGDVCVNAYLRGKNDRYESRPPTTGVDHQEATCYMTGYDDAGVVPR